jgi:hypothetical protein
MLKKIVVMSSALAFAAAVAWSAPAQAQVDHYAGYQVKHKLAKGQTGTISNAVEAAGSFEKCKVKFLLVPTDKNSNPAGGTDTYLCHQCKGGKPVVNFTVTDQFVGGAVSTKKLKLICNLATAS